VQQGLIWLLVIALIAIVFVPYVRRFRRDQAAAAERKQEASRLGVDRPRAQYPMVDQSQCIGCGACVSACPEGDVLAVVWGAAEVVNGERCVGHGYCETACPVGAIKVGLGDVTSRPDLPVLSPHNETTVPGLFIAGELGGLSLIRHAIDQGRRVVTEIVRRLETRAADGPDLIIVGAGPAGLSAALTAIEHRLSYLLIEEHELGGTLTHYPRQKLVMTQPVEIPLYGWLKKEEYSKEELVDLWQSIATEYHLNIVTGERIESIRREQEMLKLTTGRAEYAAPFVVLSLGRRGTPRRLGVPGEELPKVVYQLVDAQAYRNKQMLVVGGGDSAVEAAVGLARQPGNTVSISYRKSRFFRVKKKNEDTIGRLIDQGRIRALFDSQVVEIRPHSIALTAPEGVIEIPNDFVIVQVGGIPPFEMLKAAGIAFGGEAHTLAEADARLSPTGAGD
jgi:thioredoxin reductase/Pyruvate/2-oxoacid:ferredoxin oxidoreductase delta subunit